MKIIQLTILAAILPVASLAAADQPSHDLQVAVFNFEGTAGVPDALGAQFAGIVTADLSNLSPVAAVPTAQSAGLPGQPKFNTADSIGPEAASRLGRMVGAVALVNGRIILDGRNVTVVAKVIDADTGRVYGEMVQGNLFVSFEDLASQISVKIAGLVIQSRGLPAVTWAPATLLESPGAIVTVDGLEQKNHGDASVAPGIHQVTVSDSENGASTRALFTIDAKPAAKYRVVLQNEQNQRLRMWIADAFSSAPVTTAVDREWVQGEDVPLVYTATYLMPGPRFGVASVADSEAIYIICGQEGGRERHLLSEIVRFDLHTHVCSLLTRAVFPREFFGAALAGGKIYIIGGDAWNATLHSMQIYNIATNQLSSGPPMPESRRGFGTALVENQIYVVGGSITPPSSTNKVNIFDLETQAWKKGPPMPFEATCQTVLDGDRIIAPGGVKGDTIGTHLRADLATVQVLNVRDETWGLLPPLSEQLDSSAVAALDGRIFILGAPDADDQALAYDLGTGRSYPFKLNGRAARNKNTIVVGNLIYVIGGIIPPRKLGLASDEINVYAENPNWKSDAKQGRPIASGQ